MPCAIMASRFNEADSRASSFGRKRSFGDRTGSSKQDAITIDESEEEFVEPQPRKRQRNEKVEPNNVWVLKVTNLARKTTEADIAKLFHPYQL